jgi:hypothetical protein
MEVTVSSKSYLPRWRQQFPVSLISQDGSNSFQQVLSPKMEATGFFKLLESVYRATFYIQEEAFQILIIISSEISNAKLLLRFELFLKLYRPKAPTRGIVRRVVQTGL